MTRHEEIEKAARALLTTWIKSRALVDLAPAVYELNKAVEITDDDPKDLMFAERVERLERAVISLAEQFDHADMVEVIEEVLNSPTKGKE